MQNALSQFLNDPHIRHAALVHFPIVLAALGILPLIALLMTGLKSRALKLFCVLWFAMASGGAALAANSGEAAADNLSVRSPGITAAEHDAIEHHEELAENGWIWPLIPAVLVLLTFPKKPAVRRPAFVLAAIASLGVAYWVALTAHAGGKLVYDLGIGVESRMVRSLPEGATRPSEEEKAQTPAAPDEGGEEEHEEAGESGG